MEQVLSKQEWKVLRDALRFPEYFWSPKTCEKLLSKGLMRRNELTRGFVVTEQGLALIQASDDLQSKILASE